MMDRMDLGGVWQARPADGQRGKLDYAARDVTDGAKYLDIEVPGEIHLDLMRHGLLADPNLGLHCLAARWVEESQWACRKVFDVPEEALVQRAWLVFEGLDYAATIILNGQEVGRHANFFLPCRIEVSGMLRASGNVLAVYLDSGLYTVSDKPTSGWGGSDDLKLHKRHWLRKPQCQFGWDWAPRLINVGIQKPVRLEWTAEALRVDQVSAYSELDETLETGKLTARFVVEGLVRDADVEASVRVSLLGTGIEKETAIQVQPGTAVHTLAVELDRPQLWWPVGCGAQALYEVDLSVAVAGEVVYTRRLRTGFRHVAVVQEPHPETGSYFYLKVNHRPIFAKGGNLVPADMLYARLDRARYQTLVERALESNFNFLRVWGGGLYESDDFYALCDERGILVWQEFVFACSRYPTTDEAFLCSVKAEATWQVRRLAPHPSLVIWCGNNEMEWGAWNWGFDRGVALPDYALFHLVLPRILAEEDPSRYYQPSSPMSPGVKNPNADEAGDQHPWSVGFAEGDFRKYRQMICRFANEGGILGPTALPTMLACLPEGQQQVQSFAWQAHDNAVDSWAEPGPVDQLTERWLGRRAQDMTVAEYTYWGGLLQGEGLREYCDNFRRRMFSSGAAVFWMYNDCWPATRSWTTVDYYLRRTPSFHPVRRALAAVHLVLALEEDCVRVFGINDSDRPVAGDLRFGVFLLAGGFPCDQRLPVELPPNAATVVASLPAEQWQDRDRSMAFAMLEDAEGGLLARNRLFEPYFKDMVWPQPHLKLKQQGQDIHFESETFVWGVCLDLDGERCLPDNFFDVWPGIPYVLAAADGWQPEVLAVGNLCVCGGGAGGGCERFYG